MKNIGRKNIILSSLAILTIVIMTLGITYAVFSYTKIGSTVNTITTGTLKFIYTENTGVGSGIILTDAKPVSDEIGKTYSTENYVFDFKIESNNVSNSDIPYEITLEKESNSTLTESAIKVYLTDMTENLDTELLTPTLYSNLITSDNKSEDAVERVLYQDTVSAKTNYSKSFRLRIWIDENLDFESGSYNNQTFLSTVNVYANQSITDIEIKNLKEAILANNTLITATPTLTTSSNNTSDQAGLYSSTDTNTGEATYYFRGNVENNYVSFADQTWRIVRINEDGTIRIIMQDGINSNTGYKFNSSYNNYKYMYYTNSQVKETLESWYESNLSTYNDKIANGEYFCEQAKVKPVSTYKSGNTTMEIYSSYTPNFKCEIDDNGYGIVTSNIGLISYDEALYAGGYYAKANNSYYLYNNTSYWTMSPAAVNNSTKAVAWLVTDTGYIGTYSVATNCFLRPVLNLKADVTISHGTGVISDPFVIQ